MRQKVNILFMLPNFDTGGSEKLVLDIIRSLDPNVFSPSLAVFFTGTYEKEYMKLGYPFHVIHRDRIRSKLSTFLFLRSLMERGNIDVVNTHHTSPLIQGLIPCKVFAGASMVHTEHSRLTFDSKINAKVLFLARHFLKRVDVAVGISKGVSEYFRDELKVPGNKIRTIPNGIDLARFELNGFDAAEYRRKLGVPAGPAVIGLFANFRAEKNHKDLIAAVHLLKRRGRKAALVLCGSGPTEAEAKAQAAGLGLGEEVRFLGVRMDIPRIMNSIDIYCLPSKYEGLPFSALEAMASGKPVVGADVIGINELIKHGDNGLLAEPASPEALADAIEQLIDDPGLRGRIAMRGKEFVKRFSFEGMMREYEGLFIEMAERSRKKARGSNGA